MTTHLSDANSRVISEILAAARVCGEVGEDVAGFIDALFAQTIHEDLALYDPADLAAAALSTWEHLQQRKPGLHKIRIINPDISVRSEYGWQTAVTVIEIVNDNMPFLVDSVMGELQDRGLDVHLVLHPVLALKRDEDGRLAGPVSRAVRGQEVRDGLKESLIHIHIDRIEQDAVRRELGQALSGVLDECRLAVKDWPVMLTRLEEAIKAFQTSPPPIPVDEIAEAIQFLRWLADNNFTLLGMREYAFDATAAAGGMERLAKPGLGILANPEVKVLRRGRELVTFTPEVREFLMQPVPLIVTKANVRSRVHRRAHMDYIGIKLFSADGNMSGELRVIGLFTSTAYTRSARSIPFLRRKIDQVVRALGFSPTDHSGKALINVLEQFPRDELFQIDIETLTRHALAILQLGEHPRLRVLARPDRFDRYVSVLLYVPRDRYSTSVREKVGDYLARTYDGRVSAYYPTFLEGRLVRVHFIIGRYEGETPNPSPEKLEDDIAALVRNWSDDLHLALGASMEGRQVRELQARYCQAFPAAYQEAFGAANAVHDISFIEQLSPTRRIAIDFVHRDGESERSDRVGLKLFNLGEPIFLTDRVPVLENMGFRVVDERSYSVHPDGGESIWLHDMTLETDDGVPVDLEALRARLDECFTAIWSGAAENDGYNALVLRAGLGWRDIAILRAYSRYLRQARTPFSQDYMWQTMARHPVIAGSLMDLFRVRFDPDLNADDSVRAAQENDIMQRLEHALQAVDNLDEDRIIRHFANLVHATLRTSVYQRDKHGDLKPAMAFKIRSREVDGLPAPRPYAEIFVYSPRVEGVHLRFGAVARGGLRWSDRPQDFRTEVLGLVKAQQVKNAVIVPVGAKGGFVPKRLPGPGASREEISAEGIAAYKIFVSSLLDITDNLEGGQAVRPQRAVCHDGDDPYLVVAADKGTASFSDIANEISENRHFWLGDAFASGGSVGYDHKKMGITARGGWEAVKRHFREMDRNIQTEPFTVIGVGDMSGDVFGNGMLLSDQIHLIAAFDHRDIFIDPDPDPAASLAERRRLFQKERSSWQDYDRALISEGGGVFSRRDKSIPLSPRIQALIGSDKTALAPFELIRALLTVAADLLWFGGIGTYVRASGESEDQVGDRANDALRVSARELRVKVVGEGANLGMTQRARIEFASLGGRVNSDAIDNSAGVNSSDMEVNIKIALSTAVREERMSTPDRNRLLAEMTDEVAGLVLRNNYLQTLAISLAERRGMADFDFQARFMRDLEARGLLDRVVEVLPDDGELAEREKEGRPLTRPELAVLLAYAKITLYDQLRGAAVADDPYLSRELMRYFPPELQQRYPQDIENHQLRREIIATMLANSMINRGGATLVSRMADQTGADAPQVAAAFAAVRDSFALTELNGRIDALDNLVPGAVQLELYGAVQDLLLDQTVWFLRNADFSAGIAVVAERHREGVDILMAHLDRVLPEKANERRHAAARRLAEKGVGEELALHVASLGALAMAPDVVLVARESGHPVAEVALVYFALAGYFETDGITGLAREMAVPDYFDRLALSRGLEQMAAAQRQLVMNVLTHGSSGAEGLEAWVNRRREKLDRTRRALKEIADDGALSLSKLAVAASLLGDLVRM